MQVVLLIGELAGWTAFPAEWGRICGEEMAYLWRGEAYLWQAFGAL